MNFNNPFSGLIELLFLKSAGIISANNVMVSDKSVAVSKFFNLISFATETILKTMK